MVTLGLAVIAGLFALVSLGHVALVLKLYTEILKIRELTKNGGLMSGKARPIALCDHGLVEGAGIGRSRSQGKA